MMPPPTISVVLPTHNGSQHVEQSIASVVAQTYRDWELIIVDDASTDDTPQKIAKWTTRDPRIQAVSLKENRRLPGALNEGFRRAQGKYLTWTSDDNWYAPEALQRMLALLEARPAVDVVYADSTWVDEQGTTLKRFEVRPPESLVIGNFVGACFLYRREVHERLEGYDERLFLVEDYDFWLRASNQFCFEAMHEPLYYYRLHGGSLTSKKAEEIAQITIRLLGEWLPQATWLSREARGRGYLNLAYRQFDLGLSGPGRKSLARAVVASRRPLLFPGSRSMLLDLFFGHTVGTWARGLFGRLTSAGGNSQGQPTEAGG